MPIPIIVFTFKIITIVLWGNISGVICNIARWIPVIVANAASPNFLYRIGVGALYLSHRSLNRGGIDRVYLCLGSVVWVIKYDFQFPTFE